MKDVGLVAEGSFVADHALGMGGHVRQQLFNLKGTLNNFNILLLFTIML